MSRGLLAAFVFIAGIAAGGCDAGSDPPTNRLSGETSLYLRAHARNPVDWHPWDAEAIERARGEGKPIFLSVGYATCYWCHVMEREVFSDPGIAALMNAHFVNTKVDREERPDIDGIYMTATQLITGGGGWPNSVFLTPDDAENGGFGPAPKFPSPLRIELALTAYERTGDGSLLSMATPPWMS